VDVEDWQLRGNQLHAAYDADQAERRAMLAGIASVEDAAFDERIAAELENEETPQPVATPEWEQRDVQAEGLVGAAFEEVERRRAMMGDSYPFSVLDGAVVHKPSITGVYEICLATSLNPMANCENLPRPTVVFEWIAKDALTLYLGSGSEGFRTGWPSDRRETRERGTLRLFKELHSLCGEFAWRPREFLPVRPKPRDLKDAGLDVVVWKHFGDQRASCFFALGQCACGRTDWDHKLEDLSLKRLRNWFEGPTVSEPTRCFLVPFHIPNHAHLKEVASYAGVVLDRARIVMIAEKDDGSRQVILEKRLVNYHLVATAFAEVNSAM
jgi:hypothetical protein